MTGFSFGFAPTTATAPATTSSTTSTTGGGGGAFAMAIIGALTGATGTILQAQNQKRQLAAQASALDFQADLAKLNERVANVGAESALRGGNREIGRLLLAASRSDATLQSRTAAAGLTGAGSAREVRASSRLLAELDASGVRQGAAQAATAARRGAVNASTRGALARVSASNLRASGDSINPYLAGGTSLIGSATPIAAEWLYDRRLTAR